MPSDRNRALALEAWTAFTAVEHATPETVNTRVAEAVAMVTRIAEAFDARDRARGAEFVQDAVHFIRLDEDNSDSGDTTVARWYAYGPSWEDIDAAVGVAFEPYSCGPHAYDCCGRTFRSTLPTISPVGRAADDPRYDAIVTDRLGRDV